MKISILLVITSLLTGCFGPELFSVGAFKVTAGTAATIPHKIEVYDKYKKEQENKKRFQVNKLDEKTFEIYY